MERVQPQGFIEGQGCSSETQRVPRPLHGREALWKSEQAAEQMAPFPSAAGKQNHGLDQGKVADTQSE